MQNVLDPQILRFGDRQIPLEVRRHTRARRITLRLSPDGTGVKLVLPKRAALKEGLAFAERNRSWILARLSEQPDRTVFCDGATVPVLGETQTIRHDPAARRGVWRQDDVIWVSGFAEHLPRRVTDFLKAEARREISARARSKARSQGLKIARISLRDTSSRWGSCSSSGNLNFSWRLIFAPELVLDYVVAHEVAHLREMNHGPAFWQLTRQMTTDVGQAKTWLSRHGASLLRYG
ncbi:M48 family metallopeptidase [Pelagibius sp. Alg239-R121]|uniref:M48 family metallopeptidase n=1 Tax=Pelagibius sp. Alg239-R121 TaxID=2993448 RepID=UPI0024A6D1D2|nr:SprT family zinc-dependent metalloprotease [Pelagibius sp. Alg239-R121]